MANKRLKVRRESVVACMTCPLCSKLLVEATTISLCLHSICIYKKLSDDELDTCPVCEINLGCNPGDKLRPDHTWQYMRAKIFPVNKGKVDSAEASEVMPSASPPAKRKERSLSSLVVSMPKVSVHSSATGKRTRSVPRKSSFPRGSSPSTEELPKEELLEEYQNLNKTIQNNKLGPAKSSVDQIPDEDVENGSAMGSVKVDLLCCLVEAANGTKLSKSTSQGPVHVRAEPSSAQDESISRVEQSKLKTINRYYNKDIQTACAPTKRKRLRPPNKNTTTLPVKSPNAMQVVVRHDRHDVPIWFSLVASENQEEAPSLPQISSGFLRMKNSGMPVSVIQKYIAKKLELFSEEEITFQGQPVGPAIELRNLLDLWLKAAPATRRVKTRVGSTAKDYVMVLKYSRKSPAQTPVPECF
ncbi:hypothetical protein V2J09_022878 [Rumex salicifolius]